MKKKLRYIFELRFFPNISSFLFDNETWLRLRPIRKFLKVIDPDQKKRIIDVGAGIGRLELRLGRKDIFIYDTNEDSINIAKLNFENVKAGSGEFIEFDDNYFDWAISIHTLEHVPKNERANFILEMIRVSKEGVFLNFPEGDYAEKLCRNFLNTLQKKGMEPNKWTVEHLKMGLPLIDEIRSIIEKQNKFHFDYIFIRNYQAENLYWTKIATSKSVFMKYFLSPFLSAYKYLRINYKPSVELVLIGAKNDASLKNCKSSIQCINSFKITNYNLMLSPYQNSMN
jgi:ubiquinone/menaquinone biosynthesis C-methylase UbiE